MKNVYTAAATLVMIVRTIIGFAFMLPIVTVCALLDRLNAMLFIKGGSDYGSVENLRRSYSRGLALYYDNLSRF